MRNNLLDELIADYMGITAAAGQYRSDWFLRFMGWSRFRPTGRAPGYKTTAAGRRSQRALSKSWGRWSGT